MVFFFSILLKQTQSKCAQQLFPEAAVFRVDVDSQVPLMQCTMEL
jgi:hypothetical protein